MKVGDISMAMTEAQRAALPRDLAILNDMAEADRRGDAEAYRELRSQLQVPARTLRALKRAGHTPTTYAEPAWTQALARLEEYGE